MLCLLTEKAMMASHQHHGSERQAHRGWQDLSCAGVHGARCLVRQGPALLSPLKKEAKEALPEGTRIWLSAGQARWRSDLSRRWEAWVRPLQRGIPNTCSCSQVLESKTQVNYLFFVLFCVSLWGSMCQKESRNMPKKISLDGPSGCPLKWANLGL